MSALSEWLNRTVTGWTALIAVFVFAAFIAFVLPNQLTINGSEGETIRPPDLSVWYSADTLYETAQAYGPDGRAAYVRTRVTFDVAWPIVYVSFLATALSLVARRLGSHAAVWNRANLVPMIAGLFDLLENVCTAVVMARYPLRTPGLDVLAPVMTLAKWVTLSASFVLLAAGIMLMLTRKSDRDGLKIACVGDSITRGTFVWRRKRRSYPAQLQAMVGERFWVRDFGVNGHAVQRSADRPYWDSKAFALSSAFEPDVVLIMLGTNDSRGANWKGIGPFSEEYRKLVAHYLSLESKPRVWLLTPPALFRLGRSEQVRYGMSESAIQEMCDAIGSLSPALGCEIIDINRVTAEHPEVFRFDGVHPGGAGATLIAQAVYEALSSAAIDSP